MSDKQDIAEKPETADERPSQDVGSDNSGAPQDACSTKNKARKIVGIVLDVLLYLFLALSIFILVLTLVSKKNNGAANLFGYEMRIVASSSMEKSEYSVDVGNYDIKDLKVRSIVFVERVPEDEEKAKQWYASLKVGDVLTFRYTVSTTQETITHRIVEIDPTETGYIIKLQGDNRSKDSAVSTQTIYTSPADYPNQNEIFNYVIGKVVGNSTVIGYVMYAVGTPLGLALIVIIPCAIIIVWQILRVVMVMSEERRKASAEKLRLAEEKAAAEAVERERQAQELAELKRKVAELQGVAPDTDGNDNNDGVGDGG